MILFFVISVSCNSTPFTTGSPPICITTSGVGGTFGAVTTGVSFTTTSTSSCQVLDGCPISAVDLLGLKIEDNKSRIKPMLISQVFPCSVVHADIIGTFTHFLLSAD